MTRPALVIGLGGTGQWVLTYLKKDLIESNNGVMPSNVRLLCFDTVSQAGAEVEVATTSQDKKEEVKVGSIQLDNKTEFVHLGGDILELSQIVASDSEKDQGEQALPHLSSWFRAKEWLGSSLPSAIFRLSSGAGQLRQFGRMALFKDLSAPLQSAVWTGLDTAINQLDRIREGQQVEIIIVGSLAGGTGSGLLIDIALLARHRAGNIPILLRGYVVLPRAFSQDANDDMLARSFAAWRELNRFMVVSQEFAVPKLVYNSSDDALQIRQIKSKIFDTCYLVDGVRAGGQGEATRIAAQAELGVHPTIADAISAILDDKAGQAYTEWATNVAKEYAANQGVPMYSTVGTHTFKVPVYYAQHDFADTFTINWLNTLLKPVYDDNNPDRVIRVEATSPLDPIRTGREEAFAMLVSPQEYQGKSETPTMFYSRIKDIVEEGGRNNPELVLQYAKGSWGGRTLLESFINLGDRQDMTELISNINAIAKQRLGTLIKPSRELKESPAEFPKRVERLLPDFVRQTYGFRTASGVEQRGRFGKALDDCGQAQVDIFRRKARLWLMRTLMEGDKSGRLGYAYDLLDGLSDRLQEFLDFMDAVRAKRQSENPTLKALDNRDKKKKIMEDIVRKRWPGILPLWNDPGYHNAQIDYLKAEQAIVDARKDELVHDTIVNVVREMRQYCNEMKNELERWIRMLAIGDPATGVDGLYTVLERRRKQLEQTRHADEQLTTVQTRLGDLTYPKAQEAAELRRLMAGVKWELEEKEEFRLRLSICPTDETAIKLDLPTGEARAEVRQHITQRNLDALQGYAYRRFGRLDEETRVAERLASEHTADTFVQELGNKAEPLFDRQPGTQGGAARWSQLIRINTESTDDRTRTFVKEVERKLRADRRLDPDRPDQRRYIMAVGSADLHKCTIVRTDDLMQVTFFRAWHDCLKAYLNNRQMPPHLNHNFPAEANAAYYELMLSQKRQEQYRVFHPWVVMLLEYPDRLEQFFLCKALEWIQEKDDGGTTTWYEFNMTGFKRPFMLTPKRNVVWSIFQAARFFVLEGLDQSPRSTWTLNYRDIRKALEEEEKRQGVEAWLSLLQKQVPEQGAPSDESGLEEDLAVPSWLRARIKELNVQKEQGIKLPEGEPANYEQAYQDLADVAELMFEERLGRKKTLAGKLTRTRQAPPPPPIEPVS